VAQPAPPASAAATSAPPAQTFVVTTTLNIRGGPGAANPAVAGSPLPQGTVVTGQQDQNGWKHVVVQGTVNGQANVTGWVSAQFLAPAPAMAHA
jgi:uncharacterized protein YraI